MMLQDNFKLLLENTKCLEQKLSALEYSATIFGRNCKIKLIGHHVMKYLED